MGDGYEISIKRLAKQKATHEGSMGPMPKPKDRTIDPSGQITADDPEVHEYGPKEMAMQHLLDTVNEMKKVPYENDDTVEEPVNPDPMGDADARTKKAPLDDTIRKTIKMRK